MFVQYCTFKKKKKENIKKNILIPQAKTPIFHSHPFSDYYLVQD